MLERATSQEATDLVGPLMLAFSSMTPLEVWNTLHTNYHQITQKFENPKVSPRFLGLCCSGIVTFIVVMVLFIGYWLLVIGLLFIVVCCLWLISVLLLFLLLWIIVLGYCFSVRI